MSEDSEKTEESTERARDIRVLVQWSWILPVLESDSFALRAATGRDDDTEDDQADNRDDLDTGKPWD